MTRDLSFPMQVLTAALAAKAGSLSMRDQLGLALAALAPGVREDERETVAGFLTACQAGHMSEAGEALHSWLMAAFPVPPDAAPEFEWQRRADCGL